jgi:hypothetical protein
MYRLMICGDVTAVAWVMVLVRRNYFQKKCAHVIRQRKSARPSLSARWTSRAAKPSPHPGAVVDEKADDYSNPAAQNGGMCYHLYIPSSH